MIEITSLILFIAAVLLVALGPRSPDKEDNEKDQENK